MPQRLLVLTTPRLGRLTLLGYASHSDLLLCLIQALVQQQSAVSVARIARKEASRKKGGKEGCEEEACGGGEEDWECEREEETEDEDKV